MENTQTISAIQPLLTRPAKAKISPNRLEQSYLVKNWERIHIASKKLERDIV